MKLRCDEVEIYYEQHGSGQDIVWLAGGDMPGSSWHQFQLPDFQDFRNTTFDARGVGNTESFSAPPGSISRHAEDCIQLIEAACESPVFLAGLSMGSCIAQEVSLTRPDLVRASILMGACARKSGFIDEWESAEIALRRTGTELPEDFAVAHYALLMYPASVLGDDELWARLRPLVAQDYGHRDSLSMAEQWQACVEYDSLDRLPDCQVPLHVIAFSEDTQTPPARGKLIADTAPLSSFHLLQGLGHCSMYGHKPERVNQCIREILDQYPVQ
jgi:pimeloyl-ACP methyl ester carboxylesterase